MGDSSEGRLMMLFPLLIFVFYSSLFSTPADSHVIQKRAAFYIANETMCIVDGDVYRNGDPVPTDDECERCTCRPPGFSCVLRDCDTKPGCKAVRKVGECCPEYVCGCVHNNRLYEDGELIKDLQNNCYTCRCHGSSISCTFADCRFRGDCQPEYLEGECCPRYDHCPPESTTSITTTRATPPTDQVQQEIDFVNFTTHHVERFTGIDTTVTIQDIVSATSESTTVSYEISKDTLATIKFTLSNEKLSSMHDYDITELTTLLPFQTVTYKETTRHIIPPFSTELENTEAGLVTEDIKHFDGSVTSVGVEMESSKDLTSTPEIIQSSHDSGTRDKNKIISVKGGILVTEESKSTLDSTKIASEIDVEENKIVFVQEAGTTEFSTIEEGEEAETLQPTFITNVDLDGRETTTLYPDVESVKDSFISSSTKVDSSKTSDDVSTHDSQTTFKTPTSNEITTESAFDSGGKLSVEDHAGSIGDERLPQSSTLQTTDPTVNYASESVDYDGEKSPTQGFTTFDKELEADIAEDVEKQFGIIYKQTTSDETQTYHSISEDSLELDQNDTILSGAKVSTEYGTEDSFSTDDKITATYEVINKTSDFVSSNKNQLHTVVPAETIEFKTTDDNTETSDFTTAETRTSHNLENIEEDSETSTIYQYGESKITEYITETSIFTKVDIETTSSSDDAFVGFETSSDIIPEISKAHTTSDITSTDASSVIDLEKTSSHTIKDDLISIYSPTEITSTTSSKFTESENKMSTASTELLATAETTSTHNDLHEKESELITTTFNTIETEESFTHTGSSHVDIFSSHDSTSDSKSKDDTITTNVHVESDLTKDVDGFSTIKSQVTESEIERKSETISEDYTFSTHADIKPGEEDIEPTKLAELDHPVSHENNAEELTSAIVFETTTVETSSIPFETVTEKITTAKQIVNKTLEFNLDIFTEEDEVNDKDLKETTQTPSFSTSPEGSTIVLTTKHPTESQVFFANTLSGENVNSSERDEVFKTSSSNTFEPLESKSTTEDNSATINFQEREKISTTPEIQSHSEETTTNETENIKIAILSSNGDENAAEEEDIYTSPKHSITALDYTSTTLKGCESCVHHYESGHRPVVTEADEADKDISMEIDSGPTLSASVITTEDILHTIENNEVTNADTLNIKHDSEYFSVNEDLITSSTPANEKTLTTQTNDIPGEIPEFEPPLANILKQSMFSNQQTIIKESNLTLNQTDNNHITLNNFGSENPVERHTLTLTEDDTDDSDNISSVDNMLEEDKINVLVLNHDYTIPDSEINDIEIFDTEEVEQISEDIANQSHTIKDEKEEILTTSTYNTPSLISSNLEESTSTEESTEDGGEIPVYIYNDNEDNIDFVSSDDEVNSNSEENHIENITALKTLNKLPDTQETLLEVLPSLIDTESTQKTTNNEFDVSKTTDISQTTSRDYIPFETEKYIKTSDTSSDNPLYTNSEDTAVEENSKNTNFSSEEKIELTTQKSYEERESANKYQTSEAPLLEINILDENGSAENLIDKTTQNSNIFSTEKNSVNIEYNLTDSGIIIHSESTASNEDVSTESPREESNFEVENVSTQQNGYSSEVLNKTEAGHSHKNQEITQNTEEETSIPLTSLIYDSSLDPDLVTTVQDTSSTYDSNVESSKDKNETVDDHEDTTSIDDHSFKKATTTEIKILFGQDFTPANDKSSVTTENKDNPDEGGEAFEPSVSDIFQTEYENDKISNDDVADKIGEHVTTHVGEHEIKSTATYTEIFSSLTSPDFTEIYETSSDDTILSGNVPPLPISLKHMNKYNALSSIDKTSLDSSIENNSLLGNSVSTTNIAKIEDITNISSGSSYADNGDKLETSEKVGVSEDNSPHDIQNQNSNVNNDKSNEVVTPSVTLYDETVEYQDGEVGENDTSPLINLNINPSDEKSTDLAFDLSNKIINSSSSPEKESLNSTLAKDSTEGLEESHSPFTILEYLGDFFSTFSTFSEEDTTSHQILTSTNKEYSESDTDPPEKIESKADNSTLTSNQSYSSLLKDQFAEYGYLGGVIVTGKSKYNGTSSKENKTQQSNENSVISNESNDENIIAADHHPNRHVSETDSNSKIYSTSSINEDTITEINFSTNTASERHGDSDTLNTEIIFNSETFAIPDHSGKSTLDEIKTTNSLFTKLQDTDVTTETKDNFINSTSDITERESSIGFDISESLYNVTVEGDSEKYEELKSTESGSSLSADLNEENTNVSTSLGSTEILHSVTTEIQDDRGPEKGEEVFEPFFPEVFITEIKNDNISKDNEATKDDEILDEINSTTNYDVNFNSTTSLDISGNLESNIDSTLISGNVPPLPILLKNMNETQRNTVETLSNFTLESEENNSGHVENSSSISLAKQVDSNISTKIEFGRNIQHPLHLSDVISKVFKAPGYESEFLFSSWRGFPPSQRIENLRSKRDLKKNPERKQPIQTAITDSTLISYKQNDQTTPAAKEEYAVNKKNVLLVGGHGYKPSGFFPVTSSFIIVQSDEEEEENEYKKNTRKKTDEHQPNREATLHDASSPESQMKSNKPSKVEKTHSGNGHHF